jgi:hypothetical protein
LEHIKEGGIAGNRKIIEDEEVIRSISRRCFYEFP